MRAFEVAPHDLQIGDVKVYIISGKDDILAKTQVSNARITLVGRLDASVRGRRILDDILPTVLVQSVGLPLVIPYIVTT